MRLKKLACAGGLVAAAGLAVGGWAGVASATTSTIHPYIDWSSIYAPPADNSRAFTAIGSTHPGFADSELCINFAANGSGQPINGQPGQGAASASYSGKVNGSGGPSAQLDQLIVLQDLLTATPACTLTDVTSDDAGSTSTHDDVKHKGVLILSLAASVQSGILATSNTIVRVTYSPGQTVSTPGGATIIGTGANTVDFKLKPAIVKIKSSLNTAVCKDVDNKIDLSTLDDTTNMPTATELKAGNAYNPANAATTNVLTIRECAQNEAAVAGKAVVTKINVAGAGNASASFLYAQTVNPRTWDTTRGASCADAKDGLRVFICKGGYGAFIPFTLSVRGINTGNTGIDAKGLLHPAGPTAITGASVSIG